MWLAIAVVLVLLPICLLGLSLGVVRFLVDPREPSGVGASAAAVVALALVLVFALLIPLDVFVADTMPEAGPAVLLLYHFVFALLLAMVFFVLPFCYFFAEPLDAETDPDVDSAAVDITVRGLPHTSHQHDCHHAMRCSNAGR